MLWNVHCILTQYTCRNHFTDVAVLIHHLLAFYHFMAYSEWKFYLAKSSMRASNMITWDRNTNHEVLFGFNRQLSVMGCFFLPNALFFYFNEEASFKVEMLSIWKPLFNTKRLITISLGGFWKSKAVLTALTYDDPVEVEFHCL